MAMPTSRPVAGIDARSTTSFEREDRGQVRDAVAQWRDAENLDSLFSEFGSVSRRMDPRQTCPVLQCSALATVQEKLVIVVYLLHGIDLLKMRETFKFELHPM